MIIKSVMLEIFLLFAITLSTIRVAGSMDLSVISVTRTLSEDRQQVTLTTEFTASQEPQVEFTEGATVLPGAVTEYANGRGRISITMKVPSKDIWMKIGQFDVHYVRLVVNLTNQFHQQLSVTQTLNTHPITVTPGYDIVYAPALLDISSALGFGYSGSGALEGSTSQQSGIITDDEFVVTAVVHRHPADNFSWGMPEDPAENNKNVRVEGYYIDPATGEFVGTGQYPSIGNFLLVNKTYDDRVGVTVNLSFTTANGPVFGYFPFWTVCKTINPVDETNFVTHLLEDVVLTVHDSTTTTPFPTGFVNVSSLVHPYPCTAEKGCIVICAGHSNDMEAIDIFKVEDDGTETNVTEIVLYRRNNFFLLVISIPQRNTAGTTAKYVCKALSGEGTNATLEETIIFS